MTRRSRRHPLEDPSDCYNKRPKIKIVIGSTFGDEGKGNVVQWLCQQALNEGKRVAVCRYSGGPQAAHTVYHNGIEHICSTYGSGVLLDVPTYLTEDVLIDPISAKKERQILYSKGISSPKINCSIFNKGFITPYDVYYNQHDVQTLIDGTCGKGINATYERCMKGIFSRNAEDNLNLSWEYYKKYKHIDIKLPEHIKREYISAHNWFTRVSGGLLNTSNFDVLILEGSQGLLLDAEHGFTPHTTPSKVGLNGCTYYALFNSNVEAYFVTRTYTTRHGNGYEPKFPITIPSWKKESNIDNQFQGKFKTGLLETKLLQRAFDRHSIINTCQKFKISPRLVVTHTDLIDKNVINSFALDNNIVKFNNTEEALDILIKELDGYLDPQEVYYSDNPNSDIKQYI